MLPIGVSRNLSSTQARLPRPLTVFTRGEERGIQISKARKQCPVGKYTNGGFLRFKMLGHPSLSSIFVWFFSMT